MAPSPTPPSPARGPFRPDETAPSASGEPQTPPALPPRPAAESGLPLHLVLPQPDGARPRVDLSRIPPVGNAGHTDTGTDVFNDLDRSEEAWHHNEALLRATLDSIDDGLLVVSASGQVSHRNTRFLEIWSVPPALAASKDDRALLAHVAPQLVDPDSFSAGVETIYRTDTTTHDTLHCKDGRIIERFSAPVCTPGADPERMWRFRDVTARVQAEKALRDREARLQSIFRAAPTAIGVVVNRVIQEVNDTTCALTGYSREELIGKSTRLLHATDEDFAATSAMYGQLAGKPMIVVETRWQRKDGTLLDILLSGAPIVPDDLAQGVTFIGLDITERKRTEERFRQLAAEQQTVLDTVTTGIGLLKNRRHQWVNRSFAQMFGYSPEEIEGKDTSINYADPADYRRVGEEGYAALSAGRIYSTETRMKRRDGAIIWCEITGKAVDPGNLQAGSIWALLDITERKRTEESYRTIVQTAIDGFWTIDLHGRIQSVNDSICRILGYSREELLAHSIPDLEANEDRTSVTTHLTRIARTGLDRFETRLRRKDTSIIDVEVSINHLPGAEPRYFVFIRDISERKSREEALHRSEERFRLAIEHTGQLVYDFDIATGRGSWAGATEAMLGYSAEFLDNHEPNWWFEQVHPEDRAVLAEGWQAIVHHNRIQRTIYRFRRADATWVHLMASSVRINDAEGRPIRILGAIADVTKQQEDAEAIRRLNAELEQRVRDRTAQLEHLNADLRASQDDLACVAARLQEANANLLTANQELESFSYSVSHDLRAPLRNIAGFIELLHKRTAGSVDTEAERFFGIIAAEAVRLGGLIDSLLAFSRIGRADLKVGPVALAELVEEVRREMGPDLASRAIEWRVGALPTVRGDRALLHQVVANLVGNAVKFTRHRTPALIELGTLPPDPAAPGQTTFFVRDNGAGFNPAYADKLFRVFQRLHNASEFEGTGIGLANVKRIVVRHGGSIQAEGAVDAGATFRVTLPAQ